jgi:hypothetical protein
MNLYTRNIHTRYIKPAASDADESRVAKITSLVVKLGALAFSIFVPLTLRSKPKTKSRPGNYFQAADSIRRPFGTRHAYTH